MINEKGQIFGRINIFDLIVALLIVVLLFGGGYKIFVIDLQKTGNMKEITYDLYIQAVRDATAEAFVIGEDVIDYDSKGKIGVVTGIRTEPAKRQFASLDGKVTNALVEDRIDLYVTVKAKAEILTTGSYYVEKTGITNGSEVHITTQKTNCIATFKNVVIEE